MRKILVIGAGDDVQRLVASALRTPGVVLQHARSESEASAFLRESGFEVVLLDLSGQARSGVSVLRSVPARSRRARVCVALGAPTVCEMNERRPARSHAEEHVQSALRVIQGRYADPNLGTREIAGTVGISTEYLCRLFSKYLQTSPMLRLHHARVEVAKELLKDTSSAVKVIAHDCGYHSTSELDVHFRRALGCSPSVFRRAMQDSLDAVSSLQERCQDEKTGWHNSFSGERLH